MRALRLPTVIVVLLAAGVFAACAGAGATTRHCQTADFSVRAGQGGAALSHYRQTLRLRNVSRSSCAVSGWFTVQLLDVHGRALASREQKITSDYFGTSPKPTVVLKPSGGASFAIDTVAPATTCPSSSSVAVTAPGGHGSKRLSLSVLACATFAVLPVQPGNKAFP